VVYSPEILVSIINYRTADLTIACATSVLEDLGQIDGSVVIVDNASGDGSAEAIADWIATLPPGTPVDLVRSEENTGFSGGHNTGMGHKEAEFYLLLNSDALLHPGFCATILAAARARPDRGFWAPLIEYDDGRTADSAFRFASPVSELLRAAQVGPLTKALKHRVVSLGPDPDEAEIEWASFACILLRGDMVRALGPMDEGYFLYFEDAAYCLKARRAGWRIGYVPEARMVHFRGGSGPVKALSKARARLPAYYYASRSRFFYQAHGQAGLLWANVLWSLGRAIAHGKPLFGKPKYPAAQGEARDIWINAFNPLGPRRAPHEQPDQRPAP
jgi:N-acetylglucosaminyl-diphospho-decaprenol L-rhamnosyltransferase